MNKLLITVAALGLATATAQAQVANNFVDLDADANGELSFAEIATAWPDFTEADFSGADIDASGGLSPDEITSVQGASIAPAVPDPAAAAPGEPMVAPDSLVESSDE